METLTKRRLSLRWLGLLVLPLTLVLPATPTSAHESPGTVGPSGRSPFYALNSFSNTGLYYWEAGHSDNSYHLSDAYALDLNVDGAKEARCGRHVYALWDNLTVTRKEEENGYIRMEGNPTSTSGKYQLEYRHMASIGTLASPINIGTRVNRGTFVGKVGAKGNVYPAGACHLHLSMRKWSTTYNAWYAVKPMICGKQILDSTSYSGCT